MTDAPDGRATTRAAIIEAAAPLLRDGGAAAMTTRRVADAAGVQAPTIYRLFGDKDGLLEAVAEHVMAGYVAAKAATVAATDLDPLDDLRAGWQQQVDFGLANPAVFRLLSDPARVLDSPAAEAGRQVLAERVRRLAAAGRLRVPEPTAVALIQAAGVGTVTVLLAMPTQDRDPNLADTMLDAVLSRILTEAPRVADDATAAAAITLRAAAPGLDVFSRPERQLLAEWLERVATAAAPPR